MPFLAPNLIKQSPLLLAEEYRTTPFVMGQFDTTAAGTNTALFVVVNYNRPHPSNNTYGLTNVRFNNVNMDFVAKHQTITNDTSQSRIALYVIANPPQVNGNIDVTFDYEVLQGASVKTTVSVHALLFENVNQIDPVGAINNNYAPVVDIDNNNHLIFDPTINVETANGLILGLYYGATAARNNIVVRDSVVEIVKQQLNFATSNDRMYWLGKLNYDSTGTKTFTYNQNTYGDDVANLYFEIKPSTLAPQINLSNVVSIGTNPTVTFANLGGATPTAVTITDSIYSQSLPVVNNAGTYTVTLPTLVGNKVMYGKCSFTFVDGVDTVKADFTYQPGTLKYKTLSGDSDPSIYVGWTRNPKMGDQIIYDDQTTDVDTLGNLGAYASGTYTFYAFNHNATTSESFNVTFGEPAPATINPVGTTVTTTVNSPCIIVINHNGLTPVTLTLKDTTSKTATNIPFLWNSSNGNLTFTCKHSAEAFNVQHTLIVRMSNGTTVSTPLTITGYSTVNKIIAVPLKRHVKRNITSPYFDGDVPDATV